MVSAIIPPVVTEVPPTENDNLDVAPVLPSLEDNGDFKSRNKRNKRRTVLIIVAVAVVLMAIAGVTISVVFSNRLDCDTVQLGVEVKSSDEDIVGIIFTECPSVGARDAFLAASSRWSSIIAVNPIPNLVVGDDGLNVQASCGLQNPLFLEPQTPINNLVIVAEPIEIDGPSGVLAAAGPCFLNDGFTVIGIMIFDSDDIDVLEFDGTLTDVVLHEMGHVLGLGTLWQPRDLVQDPFFSDFDSDFFNPNAKPVYVGEEGVSAFEELTNETQFNISVEDFRFDTGESFEPSDGSVDGHWDFDTFGSLTGPSELMVFVIIQNVPHPLSLVSIRALEDLGYIVNENEADEFSLVSSSNRLRGTEKNKVAHYLSNDIYYPPGFKERGGVYETPFQKSSGL